MATAVVDVGCAKYGGDESVPYLAEEFNPDIIYGFDPSPGILEVEPVEGVTVLLSQKAAWTFDGEVGFVVAGLGGHVISGAKDGLTPCFDLAAFILGLDADEIVLKIDAEGAEYVLLPHLVAHDADLRLKMAIVEAHCEFCGIGGNGRHRDGCEADPDWWFERWERVSGAMRCEMREWNR